MLPVTSPSAPYKRGGAYRHGGMRWSRDGWLVAMFSLAAVFLLYRGINYANRTPGVTTVISTTQVLRKDSAVYTELVIDKDGKSQSTTVTSGESGVKVTVVEGGKGLASLRQEAAAAQQQQQQQQQYPGLPKDFDAQAYLLYHPDLRSLGVTSEDAARQHYLERGRAEGRVYKRIRVVLRYTACTGLINQHYSHIAAFSLAAMLGAELVLPPAVCRDSFAHYFSVFKEKNEVQWSPVPLDSLLDVDGIINYWRPRGLVLHKTPALTPFPDLTQPDVAFPLYDQRDIDPRLVARLEDVYLKNLDMAELIEKARHAVMNKASAVLQEDPLADLRYIVLDMPCSFYSLRTLSNLRVVTEVAKSLEFAPQIRAMADRIVEGMTEGGKHEYNGVHLRIEKDARDWALIMGGQQVVWHGYIKTMSAVGMDNSTRLYVASGMLTYGASVEMDRTINYLQHMGVCSEVHHKERYIPQEELEALNSEQKALLDFIVLARAKQFVGFGSSTFSFFLREYRALHGISRSSSGLVDASVIGTDPLFHSAGTII